MSRAAYLLDTFKWTCLAIIGIWLVIVAVQGTLDIRPHYIYVLMAVCGGWTTYTSFVHIAVATRRRSAPREPVAEPTNG